DADADSDGDGIPNREELDKGLNPASADSDYDGISDYDELHVYGTDPVNADSDGDGIKDGDETSLGLDPLNGSTNGVPDGEYMIHQVVDADSEALAEINTADSPYRMSIEVDAAGYVAGNLDAGETPYAHTIENDAILGNAVGLEYQDGNVESMTLKFEIAEAYRENEIGMFPGEEEIEGIKRLNVFKYFEDMNMLLPIETKFDMENHIVYTEVDEFGTYCLMDLEKWLLNFDLPETEAEVAALSIDMYEAEEEMQPEEGIYFGCTDEYNEEDSIWQEGEFIEPEELESLVTQEEAYETEEAYIMENVPMLMALDLGDGVSNDIDHSYIDNANIDIVFILQCAGLSPTDFQRQKDMIVQVAQRLERNHPNASVRIGVLAFYYNYASWLKSDGEKWFTSSASLKNVLSRQGYSFITNYCSTSEAFKLFYDTADLREDAARFVYTLYNGNTGYGFGGYYDQNSICSKFDIHYSEISANGYAYLSKETEIRVKTLIAYTKGIFIEFDGFTAGVVYEHIRQNVEPVVQPVDFAVILPTGWNQITLTQPLNSENGANSDTDTLTDWEEVNTNMISWDANGEIVLPTIYECMQSTEVSYAQSGLDRFLSGFMTEPNLDDCQEHVDYVVHNCEILPIYSNPVNEDTDRDGIYDGIDIRPMEEDEYGDKFDELINDGYIDMKTMIQTEDGFTICMTPVCDILNELGYVDTAIPFFNQTEIDENGNVKIYGMSEMANDWYFYSVKTTNGTAFSMIKLRDAVGYLSVPAAAVSFVGFDIEILQKNGGDVCSENLDSEFRKVMLPDGSERSSVLVSYFKNPHSDALYVIPQIYVRVILQNECINQNKNVIDMTIEVASGYAQQTLNEYQVGNALGNSEIYNDNGTDDKSDDYIMIADPYNPTLEEQECILAMRSGNPSYHSFAAEIVAHAFAARYYINGRSSYRADLSVSDKEIQEELDKEERPYKDSMGEFLKRQMALGDIIPADLVLNIDWDTVF
ncbi:MAG: thrombospondin type 3 repeat-containing protein, partial [Lachnospiraceae bacterium]|nr:thrombospondin type 3 repeat-containing protein [Lachnospiraceae bacterium]